MSNYRYNKKKTKAERKRNEINNMLGQSLGRYDMLVGKKEVKRTSAFVVLGFVLMWLSALAIIILLQDNGDKINIVLGILGLIASLIVVIIGRKRTKYEVRMYDAIIDFYKGGIRIYIPNWINSHDNKEYGKCEISIVYGTGTRMKVYDDTVKTLQGDKSLPCIEVKSNRYEIYDGMLGHQEGDDDDTHTVYENDVRVKKIKGKSYKIYSDIAVLNDFIRIVEGATGIRVERE